MAIKKIRETIRKLATLNNTPRQIASGVAVGVFIGCTPFYGFHSALALLCAFLIPGINRAAVFPGIFITNPTTVAFIYWFEYELGRYILGTKYPSLSWATMKQLWLQDIGRFFYPLAVGSLVLGLFTAFLFYLTTFFVVMKIRNKETLQEEVPSAVL